jgi:hypothetical protein
VVALYGGVALARGLAGLILGPALHTCLRKYFQEKKSQRACNNFFLKDKYDIVSIISYFIILKNVNYVLNN